MRTIEVERNVTLMSLTRTREDFKRLLPVFTKHGQDEWPGSAEAYVQSNEDWQILRKVVGEVPMTREEQLRSAALQLRKNKAREERAAKNNDNPTTSPDNGKQ